MGRGGELIGRRTPRPGRLPPLDGMIRENTRFNQPSGRLAERSGAALLLYVGGWKLVGTSAGRLHLMAEENAALRYDEKRLLLVGIARDDEEENAFAKIAAIKSDAHCGPTGFSQPLILRPRPGGLYGIGSSGSFHGSPALNTLRRLVSNSSVVGA